MDSDSHHSLTLSVLLISMVLFVTLLITVFVYFLLRRLRGVSLVLDSHNPSSSSSECAICLSPLEPEHQLRYLPLCCHAFHEDCIATWLVSNHTCPLCRSPLSITEDIATASLAASIGHDGSRSWLRDLSRGISSRALSFRGSARFFTGSSRRSQVVAVDLEAGEEITEYFEWLSQL